MSIIAAAIEAQRQLSMDDVLAEIEEENEPVDFVNGRLLCIARYGDGYVIEEFGGGSMRYFDRDGKWKPTSARGLKPFKTIKQAETIKGKLENGARNSHD